MLPKNEILVSNMTIEINMKTVTAKRAGRKTPKTFKFSRF